MKKEMQHLRANLVMMRKNVVKVPRKNSARSAVGRDRSKMRQDEEEEKVEDFYHSPPTP